MNNSFCISGKSNYNNIINMYRLIIFTIGIITGIIMIFSEDLNNGYDYYFIVPIIFSFMYIICFNITRFMNSAGLLIFNIVLVMKYIFCH